MNFLFFIFGAKAPRWATTFSFTMFLDHTRRATVGRTPLDERSARHTDLYQTKHNSHNRHPFQPAISAGEWLQTDALDRAATVTGEFHTLGTYRVIRKSQCT
jgi:hypothetical protein